MAKKLIFILPFTPLIGFFLYLLLKNYDIYYKLYSFIIIFFVSINLINSKFKFRFPKYYYLLILYIIYLSIWIIITKKGYSSLLFHISFILFIILKDNVYLNFKEINRLIKLFKYTIILSLIIILIQVYDSRFFTNDFFRLINEHSNIYTARRVAIFSFADKDDIGLSFLPILSILISHTIKNKKGFWFYIISGGIISILTNTRYIIIGYVIILFQIVNIYKLKISGFFRLIIITGVSIFIFYNIIISLGYNLSDYYSQRLFKEESIEGTTRYLAFETFNKFYKDNWLFGTGVHLTEDIEEYLAHRSSQIHVGYLSHLVSYGLIGSLLLFGFWIFLGIDLYKKARITNYYGSFYGYLIFIWANFTFVQYSLISYGLLLAFVFDKYYQDKYLLELKNQTKI